MKKLFALSVSLVVTLSSFSSTNNSEYGPWQTAACFSGIEFCTKNKGYNDYAKANEWWVKFRNRYPQRVHFSFVLLPSSVQSNETKESMSLRPGADGPAWSLVKDSRALNVVIGKVRLGERETGPYMQCDH